MLEHHESQAVKGSKQLQIMFTVIDSGDIIKTARIFTIQQSGIFKIVISPEEPNQQLLDTCLLLETLPVANAVADEDLMRNEVLTVMAERGQQFLSRCGLDQPIQFRTLTGGRVSDLTNLPSAGAVMSLEREWKC